MNLFCNLSEKAWLCYRPRLGAGHTQFNTLCSSFITCSMSSDFIGGLAYWPESSPCPSLALPHKNKGRDTIAFHQALRLSDVTSWVALVSFLNSKISPKSVFSHNFLMSPFILFFSRWKNIAFCYYVFELHSFSCLRNCRLSMLWQFYKESDT